MKSDIVLTGLAGIFSNCTSVAQARLFGSRARGDNKERSDYDVAVFGAVVDFDKTYIAGGIEELPTLLKVDLVYVDELSRDKFYENILKEGVIFYDRESGK